MCVHGTVLTKCWQEFAGFLTARGGLARIKGVEQHDAGTVTMDVDFKDDGVEDEDAGTVTMDMDFKDDGVEDEDAGTVTMDMDIKADDSAVLADQRTRKGNWSRKNRHQPGRVGRHRHQTRLQCQHQGPEAAVLDSNTRRV